MSSELVLSLEECSPDRALDVGGKALGLGSLLGHGLPVPPGFAVTVVAYRRSIEAAGLDARITELLELAGSPEGDREASAAIQALFVEEVLDPEVGAAIDAAYARLGGCDGEDLLVAVRSSATAEDTAEASFAGQQDTYLGIRGSGEVKRHVLRCWASLFSPHAIGYRARFRVPADGLAMGVVVQRMVPADAAGVMMTLEPVSGDRSTIYIESALGLGEGVVRGDVGSDRFWVSKETLKPRRTELGVKERAHRLDPEAGTVSVIDVPGPERDAPSLRAGEVVELAEIGRQIEQDFGAPMDVEWAIAGSPRQLTILQARPETVWSRGDERPAGEPDGDWDPLHTDSEPHVHWSRANVGEAMPGVQSPLSWALWLPSCERATRDPFFAIGALTRRERRVPETASGRNMGIFMGRVAARLDLFTRLGDRMPGTTGEETALSIYGAVPDDIDYRPTKRRYPFVALRLPRTFALTPRRVRRLSRDTDEWYRRTIVAVDTLDLDGAIEAFRDAERYFERAIVLQSTVTVALVQPLFEALTALVTRTGVGDVETLCGSGGAEMAVVGDIWRTSRGQLPFEELVLRHGFHGPFEGELSSRVWREEEAPLRRLVAEYASRDESADPAEKDAAAQLRRQQRQVVAAVPRLQRPAVRLLLRLAATRILLRGVAKRSFLQAFDVARAAARRAGALLAGAGLLEHADDVFYLTVDELMGPLPDDVKRLVTLRQARRAEYERLDLPVQWKGNPKPLPQERAGGGGSNPGQTIPGVGVSAGVAEGTARVLLTPDYADVQPDEVLVAPTTDPSWSSIMFISSALVVDMGGALSHAAVVARELGIPCVVNTGSGTRAIRTGDRVRVDGSSGTVEILARTDAPPENTATATAA